MKVNESREECNIDSSDGSWSECRDEFKAGFRDEFRNVFRLKLKQSC